MTSSRCWHKYQLPLRFSYKELRVFTDRAMFFICKKAFCMVEETQAALRRTIYSGYADAGNGLVSCLQTISTLVLYLLPNSSAVPVRLLYNREKHDWVLAIGLQHAAVGTPRNKPCRPTAAAARARATAYNISRCETAAVTTCEEPDKKYEL